MKTITTNIKIVGPGDELLDELVVDMPENITAKGLIASLRRQGILADSREVSFTVNPSIPGDSDRALSGAELQDNDTIVIRQSLPEVVIKSRKQAKG